MYLAIIFSVLCFVKSLNLLSFFKTTINSTQRTQQVVARISLVNFIQHIVLNKFDQRAFIPSLMKIYGSSFEINVFGLYSVVVLSDSKILQKLLMSADHGHLEKPSVYKKLFSGPTENGLISSKAKTWSPHRSAISKAFTYKGLMCQAQIFEDEAKSLIFNLNNALTSTNEKVMHQNLLPENVLSRLIYKSAFHAGTKIITGKTNLLSQQELDKFFELFQEIKCLRSVVLLKPWLAWDFLWNMHPNAKKSANMIKEISGLFFQITKKVSLLRLTNDECEMPGKSILELMIQSNFTNDEIFAQFVTMATTGQETVGQSLNILMMLLANNKVIQDKCFDEVKRMFLGINSKNITEVSMESLTELKCLERCIKEELRLYPTAPMIGRKLESPLVLDNNTLLDSGSNVMISLWFLHRNKDIYPDPEKFDPDRFLPENSTSRGLCEYMPFSVGPRNCIAWKSAMLEMKMYAAFILYNFEIYIDEDNDIKLDLHNIIPVPDLGVKLRRRQ